MNEFDIIERYFKKYSNPGSNVIIGIGDDAAILEMPGGSSLAVSTDTMVQGTHFRKDTLPFDIGYKSLAVNLSDMAAMGAEPLWATMSLTMPEHDPSWISEFSKGFFDLANIHKLALVGGDITRGQLSITIQIMGSVPRGGGLRRAGAVPGDNIYVTGELGMAALALSILMGEEPGFDKPPLDCLARLNTPVPRINIGMELRTLATAAIDISDGLAADLGHLLTAGSVGAEIMLSKLPVSDSLKSLSEDKIWSYSLNKGDDYELCFTAGPDRHETLMQMSKDKACKITHIGQITQKTELKWLSAPGTALKLYPDGYRHF